MASNEAAETSVDEVAVGDDDSAAERSWGPIRFPRVRSVAAGSVLVVAISVVAVVGIVAVGLGADLLAGGSLPSSTLLLVALLFIGGPFSLLYWVIAYDESTSSERQSLREAFGQSLPEWSSFRPLWIGCGAVLTVGLSWLATGSPFGALAAAPFILGVCVVLLSGGGGGATFSVDPEEAVVRLRYREANRTFDRPLRWSVGFRRVDLLGLTLLVFSNRGKRWYSGIHLLPVPTEQAPAVEATLRELVDGQSPPRIDRDERIIIGGIGASMLAVGPLLYLLSGEGAVLLLVAGPSTLVAHFALLHAHRG